MRKHKIALAVLILGAVTSAAFLTAGSLTGELLYHLIALWLAVPIIGAVLAITFLVYRRSTTRSAALDRKLDKFRSELSNSIRQSQLNLDTQITAVIRKESTILRRETAAHESELVQIRHRVQNTEAKILGKLENELLSTDERVRHLGGAIAKLQENAEHDSGHAAKK